MNYQPVTTGNQSNSSAGFQGEFDAEKAGEEANQQYMLFPVWSTGSLNPQNKEGDDAFDGKEHDVEKPDNDVSVAGPIVPTGGQNYSNSTNPFSVVGPSNTNTSPTHEKPLLKVASQLFDNSDMLEMEDIAYSDHENVGAEADFNNLETSITVRPIPTTRTHKAHPISQIIGDLSLTTQTRSMTKVIKDQGGLSQIFNEDFHTCMSACFLLQEEPKRVHQALKDPTWIEAMQKELLQFKMKKVWILVDLPHGKRAIGTKWAYRNKKDERGIVVRNKARLVAQGHTQEEEINYEEVFAPVARIEAIRLFLAYASFMGFMVHQMDVKSAYLYGTIEEEVYVCQALGFEDPNHPDKVYKVVKALYGLHQAPRAWCHIVTKPHNKTPYEFLHGRTPSIGFMRPFGCPVTILNTLDSLGKFEGKVDEGFLVRYSVNSKAFRVFNSRTRIIQETLHVNFLENKSNAAGTGPTWLFDIDSLTRTINYQPVTTGNQTNPSAGFQETFDADKAKEEANQQYVVFPMWSTSSSNPQNKEGDDAFDEKEHDAEKPESAVNFSLSSSALSGEKDDMTKKKDKGKSHVKYFTGHKDLNADFENYSEDSSNDVSAAGPIVPTAGDTSQPPHMLESEDIVYSDHEDDGAEADFNNLKTSITEEPKRVHQALKDPRFMVYQMDVKSAFLYGTIDEEVYVCQPLGFEDLNHPDKVYKVVKALYGLHQAPRAW
nr:putative ribonuclease H-like domain-containing protein [Tanacetum cinerariifolium]